MSVESTAPKVTVCVITYNHERYIADCLQGLVDQETDFPFEVVVAEDCSTDGTRSIVLDYAARHPGKVRAQLSPRNLGGTQTFLALHNAAAGDYVAHVDGDDLVLPGKLSAQARFLDEHPDLVACSHQAQIIDEGGRPTGRAFPRRLRREFDLAKVVRCGMPVINSTVMYRREARRLRAADHEVFDWDFLTDILGHGSAGYIPSILGRYRINLQSFTSELKRERMLNMLLESYCRFLQTGARYKSDAFAYVSSTTSIACGEVRNFQPCIERSFGRISVPSACSRRSTRLPGALRTLAPSRAEQARAETLAAASQETRISSHYWGELDG